MTELAAPVVDAAERLRLVTEAAETQKARATGELRHALLHLGCSVASDERHRAQLARVLYWGYPGIPVRDIVAALGFADQRSLVAAAGPVDSGIACQRCAQPLVARNRSGLSEIQKEDTGRRRPWSRARVCEACRDAQAEAEEWDRDWPWDEDYANPAA